MAPPMKRRKRALATAAPPPPPVIDPADRLSKLPDEIMAQILSFLPAQEAVRTCVLARAWRHVWKFTRRLLITGRSVEEVREFVDRLLCVRRRGLKLASFDACEIRFDPYEEVEDNDEALLSLEDESNINRWIRWVLKCEIQMLRVDIDAGPRLEAFLGMSTSPLLVSRHLARLELTGVLFVCRCINLDGCPELEHLEINECCLQAVRKITSLSLKRLVIESCDSDIARHRIQICVPRLVSLLLDYMDFKTPLLERMPQLVGAKVQIDSNSDSCSCEDPMACYHVTRADIDSDNEGGEEGSGDYAGQNTTKCTVLEGLAQAKDLVLMADKKTYIFRRDLRWCPTFSKLKTLVLNDDLWCESTDCSALACMLEHAPVLEKLTVLFSRRVLLKYDVVVEGRPYATGKSTMISTHLKIVEVKCSEVHQGVLNVLKFLGTLNIWFQVRVAEVNQCQAGSGEEPY